MERTPLGAELEISLSIPQPGSRRTRRELYEQLRTAIRTGRLAPGLRMPASRHLAQHLGVSRNTVITVYDLLISEGDLEARPGSGTFVSARPASEARQRPLWDMEGRIRPIWRDAGPISFTRSPRHFVLGAPDLAAFPWELWRKIASRTLRSYSRAPIPGVSAQGAPALRQAIAGHLSFARGVACQAEDIVVTSGAQQAFDLLAKVLVHRPGVVVAVEDPGYGPIRKAFSAEGATVVGVPVDDEGIVVDALESDVEVVCVSPSHQFPLGVPMSPARRRALLDFARRTGAVVIEDDYDGEFRFDGRPLEALQTLDVTQQVLYVGTFSKSLFPDLRLGFVVAPEWARAALEAAKMASDARSPIVAQHTLAAFIAEGHLARHVRRMRRMYGERRQTLLEAVGNAPPGWLTPYPSAAGLHLALRLPPEVEQVRFVGLVAALGVGIYPLSQFTVGPTDHNGVALGYGTLPKEDVRIGGSALVEAAFVAAKGWVGGPTPARASGSRRGQ